MPQKRQTPKGTTYWLARWTDAGGKQRQKSFTTRREAKAHEEDQNKELRLGEWIPSAEDIALFDAVTAWANTAETSGTRADRLSLRNNLGNLAQLPLKGVRPKDLNEWLDTLLSGRPWRDGTPLSPGTVTKMRSQLSGLFSRAVRDGLVARTPFTTDVRSISAITLSDDDDESVVDSVISLEDAEKVIHAARHGLAWEEVKWVGRKKVFVERNLLGDDHFPVIAELGLNGGMRGGEAGGFNVGDWDKKSRTLRVRRQSNKTGNGTRKLKSANSRRDLPVSDRLEAVLDEYLFHYPGNKDRPLVMTKRGNRWCSSSVGRRLLVVCEAVGVDDFTFHDFRHLHATTLLSGGLSPSATAMLMGHTPEVLMRVYAHFLPEDSTRALQIINSELGGNRGEVGSSGLRVVG